MQLSNHVVKGYGWTTTAQPAGWDYETETPLRDIRGYELSRSQAHPDQLTDADLGMANVILTNGARLYVDHAHPEYSGPGGDQRPRRRPLRQGGRRGDGHRRRAGQPEPRPLRPAVQEQHRRQGRLVRDARELPARAQHPVRPGGDPVHRFPDLPAGDHRSRPGRGGAGQPAARLPDQPTSRLLRGGGRAGDHPQPADHQHPRRTARRRQPAPTAARDHRRREPVGDLDLPQGRYGVLGAAGHRGRAGAGQRTGRPTRARPCGRSATTRPAGSCSP